MSAPDSIGGNVRQPNRGAALRGVAVLAAVGVAVAGFVAMSAGASSAPPLPSLSSTIVENEAITHAGGRMTRLVGAARVLFSPAYPLALESADHNTIVYNAWEGALPADATPPGSPKGTPLVRVADVRRGTDRVLARGAQTVALKGDGAVAYFKADNPTFHANETDIGHVVVRASVDAAEQRLTTRAARYSVLAWASDWVLFHETPAGMEGEGRLLAAGAGEIRVLGEVNTRLLAVSPDGSTVLVAQDTQAGQVPAMSFLDVATGKVVGRLAGGPAAVVWMGDPSELGDWASSEILLSTSKGFAIVRTQSGSGVSGAVVSVIEVPLSVGLFIRDAYFADRGASVQGISISALPKGPTPQNHDVKDTSQYTLVSCSRVTSACVVAPLHRPISNRDLSVLRNPSRPTTSAATRGSVK